MTFQQHLLDLGDLLNFSDLSTFTQNIPVGRVESALCLSTQAPIRRRRLPSDQVLWLVLGMVLFRDEPVHEGGAASEHLRGWPLATCWPEVASPRPANGLAPIPYTGCSA